MKCQEQLDLAGWWAFADMHLCRGITCHVHEGLRDRQTQVDVLRYTA